VKLHMVKYSRIELQHKWNFWFA